MVRILGKTLTAILFMAYSLVALAAETLPEMKVYKSATCGCCAGWIEHLKENGFEVVFENVSNLNQYKQKAGLPRGLGSCHTGFIDGYAVEGHVPAGDIKKLLQERPNVRGIAVPGMPMGSPGMDFGPQKESYETLSYTRDGAVEVFAKH